VRGFYPHTPGAVPTISLTASIAQATPFGGLPDLLLVAGVALVTVWAFASLRRRLRERDTAPPRERVQQRMEEIGGASAKRRELEEVMADATELSRRLAATLDNKAARIEKLIQQADDRLAQLDAASKAEPRSSMIEHRATRDGVSSGVDPVTRRIYDLADDGMVAVDIARELDEHVGKVELILALRS